MKQSHLAEHMGVAQTTISRWESGAWRLSADDLARALAWLQGRSCDDAALRRLIESSPLATHLIHDIDHRLIAASPARDAQWSGSARAHAGRPLWRYATDAIVEAEAALEGRGWWELAAPAPVHLITGPGGTDGIRVVAGAMVWERMWLSDGSPARLCTSLPAAA
jgi:transcriptional regulator with XRE-family HTH domain